MGFGGKHGRRRDRGHRGHAGLHGAAARFVVDCVPCAVPTDFPRCASPWQASALQREEEKQPAGRGHRTREAGMVPRDLHQRHVLPSIAAHTRSGLLQHAGGCVGADDATVRAHGRDEAGEACAVPQPTSTTVMPGSRARQTRAALRWAR